MSFATLSKLILLLIWPFIFLILLYFSDKEKFKQRWKKFKIKDWRK
ncbi:hypothetical protein [methane-oxidizing endosymbiont of Gigantopelta aegis]|nr:hypothetical protein [methane-oxidizing endosymbiont of Gigantopelta aegis]